MSPRAGYEMALFGMVWLLRVRSEMRRCAKCRREQQRAAQYEQDSRMASQSTFFTIDTPGPAPVPSPGHSLATSGPTTFCEVHGFMPPKDGSLMNQQHIHSKPFAEVALHCPPERPNHLHTPE